MAQPTFTNNTGVGFGVTTDPAAEPTTTQRPAATTGQPRFNNGTGTGFSGDNIIPVDSATFTDTRVGDTGFDNGTGVGFGASEVISFRDYQLTETADPITGGPIFRTGTGVGFADDNVNPSISTNLEVTVTGQLLSITVDGITEQVTLPGVVDAGSDVSVTTNDDDEVISITIDGVTTALAPTDTRGLIHIVKSAILNDYDRRDPLTRNTATPAQLLTRAFRDVDISGVVADVIETFDRGADDISALAHKIYEGTNIDQFITDNSIALERIVIPHGTAGNALVRRYIRTDPANVVDEWLFAAVALTAFSIMFEAGQFTIIGDDIFEAGQFTLPAQYTFEAGQFSGLDT